MIRRSPSEAYFKYLIVHPDNYTNETIKNIANELNLETLGDWYLQWLRSRLRPPDPFYPDEFTHGPSQRFLFREGLRHIFSPNEDMQHAFKILNRPRLRELVEVMCLSSAPPEAISYGLDKRLNFRCSMEAIRLYRHYFWDLDLLDTTEIRAFLRMRFEKIPDVLDQTIRHQYLAFSKVMNADPRVTAARLPASPLTSLIAQIQMGVMPKNVSLTDVVEATRFMASARALEAVSMGGPGGAQMSQQYAVTADIMNKILETVVKPEEELRKDLRRIALRTAEQKVPLVKQLTGGHHTTELVKQVEKPEEEHEQTG